MGVDSIGETLEEALNYARDRSDTRDSPSGQPRPNDWMALEGLLDSARDAIRRALIDVLGALESGGVDGAKLRLRSELRLSGVRAFPVTERVPGCTCEAAATGHNALCALTRGGRTPR